MDDSASIFCAREMRGIISIENAVTLRAASLVTAAEDLSRPRNEMYTAPSGTRSASCLPTTPFSMGSRTLATIWLPAYVLGALDGDGRAGGAVGVVGEAGGVAGAGLDHDLLAGLDQAGHGFGDERDAGLARRDLLRYGNAHAAPWWKRVVGRFGDVSSAGARARLPGGRTAVQRGNLLPTFGRREMSPPRSVNDRSLHVRS